MKLICINYQHKPSILLRHKELYRVESNILRSLIDNIIVLI